MVGHAVRVLFGEGPRGDVGEDEIEKGTGSAEERGEVVSEIKAIANAGSVYEGKVMLDLFAETLARPLGGRSRI